MDDRRKDQAERIVKRYAHLIEMQTGKAVRPYSRPEYLPVSFLPTPDFCYRRNGHAPHAPALDDLVLGDLSVRNG